MNLHYAHQIAYSSKEVVNFTHAMAVKFKNANGVFVECGCAAGAQVIALHTGAPNKMIYAFDSWAGIPLCSNRDDQMPGIALLSEREQKALPNPGEQALVSSGATVVPIEVFLEHLEKAGVNINMVCPVKGWFEESIPKFIYQQETFADNIFPGFKFAISILRLDGDLYNSTWVCLQHLFPKVIPGGCVIIDDWTLKGCQDACKEYFELIGYEPNYQYLDGTAWFYK